MEIIHSSANFVTFLIFSFSFYLLSPFNTVTKYQILPIYTLILYTSGSEESNNSEFFKFAIGN